MDVGILGYGTYVPVYRIKADEYREAWGNFAAAGVKEKSVLTYDEDVMTMGLEASKLGVQNGGVDPPRIRTLYVATTTPPYEEKPVSTMVAVALTMKENIRTADFTATPRAGTSAFLAGVESVLGFENDCALVVASDAPLFAVDSNLEHAAGAAAVAFLLGKERPLAVLEETYSLAEETLGERFRRAGERYIQDLELRMSFLRNGIKGTVEGFLNKTGKDPKDIDHVAFYQPDGQTMPRILGSLGFQTKQMAAGQIGSFLGDLGTASALFSLAVVLEKAEPGQRILVVAYGSGGEAFSLIVQEAIQSFRSGKTERKAGEGNKTYINYIEYLKIKGFLSSRLK